MVAQLVLVQEEEEEDGPCVAGSLSKILKSENRRLVMLISRVNIKQQFQGCKGRTGEVLPLKEGTPADGHGPCPRYKN